MMSHHWPPSALTHMSWRCFRRRGKRRREKTKTDDANALSFKENITESLFFYTGPGPPCVINKALKGKADKVMRESAQSA